MEKGDKTGPGRADREIASRKSSLENAEKFRPPISPSSKVAPSTTLPLSLSLSPPSASPGGGGSSSSPAAAGLLHHLRRLLNMSISSNNKKTKRPPPRERAGKSLSRRLNSVEAFFAWGAEVKGAFSIGLCVQLRASDGRRALDPGLLRDAASEASLLDQPLARAVVCHAASFDPLRPPRLVLAAGAPAPEFAVLRRRGGAHWERELERACNRPFRSEEVVLPAGAGVGGATGRGGAVRAQRACSFVLLLRGEDGEGEEGGRAGDGADDGAATDDGGKHHELVVRLHHALFDGKAAVAFVGAVLRRYEAKIVALEAAEGIAAAVEAAALAAAAAAVGRGGGDGGEGAATPPRTPPLLPPAALSSSPVTPLARWPSAPSTPGAFGGGVGVGGGSRSLSPDPRSPLPLPPPPSPPPSSPFASLPPSSSALSLRLGPRAFFTRIVANVMLMHKGLALARKGLGLKLPRGGGEQEEEREEGGKGTGGDREAPVGAPPPPPPLSSPYPPSPPPAPPRSEERCAVSTFALSVEETGAFLLACRCRGSSANSALAAAALASASAVGGAGGRGGGLSLQTHFDLRGPLGAAGLPTGSPPVGLCSFSEIRWFPRAAFEARGGDGGGGGGGGGAEAATEKLWSFAKSYGRSVRDAGRVPAGAGLLQRICGPWRMMPPLTFRLQVRKGHFTPRAPPGREDKGAKAAGRRERKKDGTFFFEEEKKITDKKKLKKRSFSPFSGRSAHPQGDRRSGEARRGLLQRRRGPVQHREGRPLEPRRGEDVGAARRVARRLALGVRGVVALRPRRLQRGRREQPLLPLSIRLSGPPLPLGFPFLFVLGRVSSCSRSFPGHARALLRRGGAAARPDAHAHRRDGGGEALPRRDDARRRLVGLQLGRGPREGAGGARGAGAGDGGVGCPGRGGLKKKHFSFGFVFTSIIYFFEKQKEGAFKPPFLSLLHFEHL